MSIPYTLFLRSPYWRALRRQILAYVPECERCGCRQRLQVHHFTYDYLGTRQEYYEFRGLEVLCKWCHATHHGLPVPPKPRSLIAEILERARLANGSPVEVVQ